MCTVHDFISEKTCLCTGYAKTDTYNPRIYYQCIIYLLNVKRACDRKNTILPNLLKDSPKKKKQSSLETKTAIEETHISNGRIYHPVWTCSGFNNHVAEVRLSVTCHTPRMFCWHSEEWSILFLFITQQFYPIKYYRMWNDRFQLINSTDRFVLYTCM